MTEAHRYEQLAHSRHAAAIGRGSNPRSVDRKSDTTVAPTGAVPAMKPEAAAIGDPQDGRWKITLMFDGRRFCILKFRPSTLQQMTRQ